MQEQRAAQRSRAVEGQQALLWQSRGDLAGNGSAFSAVGRYAPAIRYLTGGTKDQVSAAQWQAAWPFFISLRHLKWSLSAELLEVGVRAAHWRAGL
ncbi:hypothetical protein WJX84_000977 [Apatococcus fuscideae]|uniref:Uncharacterized protein n=1 Tax=Apatococcus fuscideae TaxID=2026836 RepID=A0AAW1SVI5_9CHLO